MHRRCISLVLCRFASVKIDMLVIFYLPQKVICRFDIQEYWKAAMRSPCNVTISSQRERLITFQPWSTRTLYSSKTNNNVGSTTTPGMDVIVLSKKRKCVLKAVSRERALVIKSVFASEQFAPNFLFFTRSLRKRHPSFQVDFGASTCKEIYKPNNVRSLRWY